MRATLNVLIVINALVALVALVGVFGGKSPAESIMASLSFLSLCVLLGAQAVSNEVRSTRKELGDELRKFREHVEAQDKAQAFAAAAASNTDPAAATPSSQNPARELTWDEKLARMAQRGAGSGMA